MDQELKQHFDELRRRLNEDMNRRFDDVDRRFDDMNHRFDELKQYVDAKFATKEDLERVETSLLTAFHQWASPSEVRARAQRDQILALDLEIDALKDRVKKLEEQRPN